MKIRNPRQLFGLVLLSISLIIMLAGIGYAGYQTTFVIRGFSDFLHGDVTADEIRTQVGVISTHLASAWLSTWAVILLSIIVAVTGVVLLSFRKRTVGQP